jgi:hypothetical protein
MGRKEDPRERDGPNPGRIVVVREYQMEIKQRVDPGFIDDVAVHGVGKAFGEGPKTLPASVHGSVWSGDPHVSGTRGLLA